MFPSRVDWYPMSEIPVRRAWFDDYAIVVISQTAGGAAALTRQELGASDLSGDEAFALAFGNLARRARELTWRSEGDLRFAVFDGADDSGLLLLDDIWEPVMADLGGPLAAVAPTADMLAVGRADRSEDVERLRELVRAAALSTDVVSEDVFVRPSGDAWMVLK
jgi:hypothetical protein